MVMVVVGMAIILPGFAFAQSQQGGLGGQNNQLTKYEPGTCIENMGGKWQQLADGTWAPPNDPLNTCEFGVPQSWVGNPAFDPWNRAGLDQQYPFGERMSQYPWGNNYPGGYENSSDWLTNCVLVQSLIQRPECQAYPRYSTMMSNYTPWGQMFNQNMYLRTQIGNNVTVTARIPLTQKIRSGLSSILVGWTIGRLMQ